MPFQTSDHRQWDSVLFLPLTFQLQPLENQIGISMISMIKKSHRKIIAKLTCINNNIFLCKFHILNGNGERKRLKRNC